MNIYPPTTARSPKNSTSTLVNITTPSVTTPATAIISGTFGGVVQRFTVVVLPANAVTIASINLQATIQGGSTLNGTVTLTGPAPAGGALITFGGSRVGIIDVSPSVTIPANATLGFFSIAAYQFLGTAHPADITATYGGITQSTRVTILPVTLSEFRQNTSTIQCASLALAPCFMAAVHRPSATVAGDPTRYYLYTPELQLMAETEQSTISAKAIAYSYLWFGGEPVAQIDSTAGTTRWYAVDHLGTPYLLTDSAGTVVWRAEYSPYGDLFTIRTGDTLHQPLRLPGQNAEDGTDLNYNIFRHYRSSWGRYTQADPIGLQGGSNLYSYAADGPVVFGDVNGLSAEGAASSISDLAHWVKGDLPPVAAADPLAAVDLAASPTMAQIRGKYTQAGCKDGRYYGNYQYTELTSTTSVTGQIVGAFGADIRRVRNCTVVIKAFNTWGTSSATRLPEIPGMGSNRGNPTVTDMLGGAPVGWPSSVVHDRPRGGPMQNATLNYVWMEELCCCKR